MRRTWIPTITLAVLMGAALAWVYLPGRMDQRALTAITSTDAATRRGGWEWLAGSDTPSGEPRVAHHLDAIKVRLVTSGDPALLDAGSALRSLALWTWDRHAYAIILRELGLRAAGGEGDHVLAAEQMMRCPRGLAPSLALPVFDALLASPYPQVGAMAFGAAAGWAGPEHADRLARLVLPDEAVALRRARLLALTWSPLAPPTLPEHEEAGLDVLEAGLLLRALAQPEDATPVIERMESWTGSPRPAFEYVLRHSPDERATRALERRADAGSRAARYALHARSPHVDTAQARLVAGDALSPISSRRLAAWRWDDVPPDTVEALLTQRPGAPGGTGETSDNAWALALLAERRLPHDRATALCESWIRSFSDQEKQAGALLAALLGAHQDLLKQAHDLENMAPVRTTQRLALWAMGERVGQADPRAFAFRTLRRADDGDFSADTALCMLLAGEADALALLTSQPPEQRRAAVQQRAWLLERFMPEWHEAAGRPVGGNPRGVRLHFDRLDALRLLSQRGIAFNPPQRTYTTAVPETGAGAEPGVGAGVTDEAASTVAEAPTG